MSGNANSDIWIAGAFAAFTVDLLVYPLDTIKTRLQAPDYRKRFTYASTNSVNKAALFRGVYQGVGSVIIATLPSSGAFFTTYEGVKHILTKHEPVLGESTHLLAQDVINLASSSIAELVSCAILTPAEVIKQNAQMVDSSTSKTNATVQTLQRFRANPFALWRGYAALAGRNLPFTALQFPIFERFREAIKAYRQRRGLRTDSLLENGIITAASAGTAGSIAAVITTPVDVVKTRIMLAAAGQAAKGSGCGRDPVPVGEGGKGLVDALGKTLTQPSPFRQKSSLQITREIVAEQGYKGLWRGGALRAVWTMVGSGLYLGVYESGRIYLAQRRGEMVDQDDL